MANKTFKLFSDKMGGRTASEYIGIEGEIFYDPTTTSLRISDGSTVGGQSLSSGGNTGYFTFANYTMSVPAGEDMYIVAGDDLFLDALEDDIHLRAEDDIRIKTGYNFDPGVDAAQSEWVFLNTGNLTLPANGNIIDSTGVSQLANRAEGNWTVTTGSNTYSFTIPSDGTYVMWVKGNIPNGIITWNATASVTNANVPVIGSQFAWNYTGGGSPISLTAIPNQIRGVSNTISTDATYAGSSSNRFDFTINNTSGASQIVYYGYTKI